MVPANSSVDAVLAVFDVDGVVADVRHRLHHLRRHRWHHFFAEAGEDPLLAEGAALVAELGAQHEIVWLTGRPDWLRPTTLDWLERHGLPTAEVHMRADGDFRPARVFKLEVLRRLRSRGIAAVVDDDVEVVEAALAAGYPAVLADWVPRDGDLREAQERLGRT
jgi:phosphoglycolate phosphatase-like HAD superfamily hydrolase